MGVVKPLNIICCENGIRATSRLRALVAEIVNLNAVGEGVGFVDCCVTSPPYYALRDYGMDEQIGLEETPQAYIDRLTDVFMEVYRVLKPTGTCWLNIGDSYCGTGDKGDYKDPKNANGRNGQAVSKTKDVEGCKHKDIIGIPWMLAFSLRAKGWYLRQDIIWHKPNPMPESVTDRCTQYAIDVLEGRIVAGETVKMACQRHLDDLEAAKAAPFAYYFDVEASEEIINFAEELEIAEGDERQKITLYPFQCFILGSLNGWRKKAGGHRRYRTSYVQLGRQNGKSFLNGILAAVCVIAILSGGFLWITRKKK